MPRAAAGSKRRRAASDVSASDVSDSNTGGDELHEGMRTRNVHDHIDGDDDDFEHADAAENEHADGIGSDSESDDGSEEHSTVTDDEEEEEHTHTRTQAQSSARGRAAAAPAAAKPSHAGSKPVGAAAAASESDRALACTVHVEGIPWTCTEEDVREFFHTHTHKLGEIVSLRAPRFHDSGKLRGYAHVEFSNKAAAAAALKLDGQHLGERYLRISAAKPAAGSADAALALSTRGRPKGCACVFVKGLPYESDEEAVKKRFEEFGKVASVRLAMWHHTGRRKGFGYVTFEHGFSAEAAVKAYRESTSGGPPIKVDGRVVHLDYETGAPRAGFKAPTGQNFRKTEEAVVVKSAVKKAKGKDTKRESKHAARERTASVGSDDASSADETPQRKDRRAPHKHKKARAAAAPDSEED